jgi:hypothetical protein
MLDQMIFVTDTVQDKFNYANRKVHADACGKDLNLICPQCSAGPFGSVKELV